MPCLMVPFFLWIFHKFILPILLPFFPSLQAKFENNRLVNMKEVRLDFPIVLTREWSYSVLRCFNFFRKIACQQNRTTNHALQNQRRLKWKRISNLLLYWLLLTFSCMNVESFQYPGRFQFFPISFYFKCGGLPLLLCGQSRPNVW